MKGNSRRGIIHWNHYRIEARQWEGKRGICHRKWSQNGTPRFPARHPGPQSALISHKRHLNNPTALSLRRPGVHLQHFPPKTRSSHPTFPFENLEFTSHIPLRRPGVHILHSLRRPTVHLPYKRLSVHTTLPRPAVRRRT